MGDWIYNSYYKEHATDIFMKELQSFYMSLPQDVKQYNKEIGAIKPLVRLQAFIDKVVSKIKFPRIAITWK